MSSVLMTGVTGVMGAEVGAALTISEDVFFIVRKESLAKVPKTIESSKVIIGDITLPMCGVSPHDMTKLLGISKIIHLAADVSFSPVDKDGKIRLTNFAGTENVLNLTTELGVKELHYCSTVYATDDAIRMKSQRMTQTNWLLVFANRTTSHIQSISQAP